MKPELEQEENDIRRALKDIAVKNAIRHAPVHTLRDMLDLWPITGLRKLARMLSVKYYARKSRPELVAETSQALVQPDLLMRLLDMLEKVEWETFRSAAGQACLEDDAVLLFHYITAQHMALLQSYYHDNRIIIVVPDEIKAACHQLTQTGYAEQKERDLNVLAFARAATNLYGVIPMTEFAELFNSMNDQPISAEELTRSILRQSLRDSGLCLWREFLVAESFADDDFKHVKDLLDDRTGKPRYTPNRATFLKYADPDYHEPTPQLEALRRNLSGMIHDNDLLDETMDQIRTLCASEARPRQFFDLLNDAGVVFDGLDQVNETMRLYSDVHNSTRLWSNYGHSPNELRSIHGGGLRPLPASRAVPAVKTGRNEPCPCGSGKKHKNCCGR